MQDYRFVQVLYVSYAFSVAEISALVAAIVLDRWGPNLLLSVGVIILAAGMAVFGYVSGMPGLIYAAIPVGVGAAVIGTLILFPVFAKGCTQFRGTAIGLVALLGSIAVMPAATGVITDRLSPEVAGLAVASVLVLLALILLKFLPIFYPPRSVVGAAHKWRRRAVEEAAADIRTLVRQRSFWISVVLVGPVMGLNRGMAASASIVSNVTGNDLLVRLGVELLNPTVVGFFALCWRIASDRIPARRLLFTLAGIAALAVSIMLLGWTWSVSVAILLLAVVSGGAIVLPWILLADNVGTKYVAVVGVVLVFSPLNGPLGGLAALSTGYLSSAVGEWTAPIPIIIYAMVMAAATFVIRLLSYRAKSDSD